MTLKQCIDCARRIGSYAPKGVILGQAQRDPRIFLGVGEVARFDTIAVYMMASAYRGVIYLGVTSDLVGRVSQHRNGEGSKFTSEYWCRRLVWYEVHRDMAIAIQRETSLKRYLRAGKSS